MKKCIFITFVLAILTACQGPYTGAPVIESGERKSAVTGQSAHRVRSGETLYSIAWQYGMDYKQLASLNKIRSPYTIFVDQVINIKPGQKVVKKVAVSKRRVTSKKKSLPAKKPAVSAKPSDFKWHWPLKGKVVSGFSLKGNVNKGVDISGKLGASVRVAAPGTVVYAGGGLRGYGKLVIVKHNARFLSAYGNNRSILVKEGEKVRQGKVIGKLGPNASGGQAKEVLHFEIRRDGKPQDPLLYLPEQ